MSVRTKDWVTLIFLSLVWGSSFILIKKGIASFSPYQVAGLRITLAGLAMLPMAIHYFHKLTKSNWIWIFICAMLGNLLPMLIFPIAQKHIDSSVAGAINSTLSLFVILIGLLFLNVKVSLREFLGVIFAIAGVLILYWANKPNGVSTSGLFYFLLIVLSTVFYAIAVLVTKAHIKNIPPRAWTSFIMMMLLPVGILMLLYTGFFTNFNTYPNKYVGITSIAILALLGTVLASILNNKLIRETSSLFASNVSLLLPVVATLWGFVDGENIGTGQIVGAIIIILSVYFGRKTKKDLRSIRK